MEQISNFSDSIQSSSALDNSQLAKNAALAVRVALGSDWSIPGDAMSTVADAYMCNKLKDAINTADDEQPVWEEYILNPLLATHLAAYAEVDMDSKLVTQTACIVLLSYDIIRQRNAAPTQADYDFIENTFDRFLTLEGLVAIREIVGAENERCSGPNMDFGKVNGLFVLEALLSEAVFRAENEGGMLPKVIAANVLAESVKPPFNNSRSSAIGSSPPHLQNVTSRDVHVQYYLKSGCALEVDCVISIDLPNKALVLETSDGRRVCIEEGVIVSEVEGKSRTFEIRAPATDGFELSATVIIAPDNKYTIEDVTSVERVDEMLDWTVFETSKATVWVGNGKYMYERSRGSVTVKNLFNV